MELRELEVMRNFYYGRCNINLIWSSEIDKLHKSNNIRKIYEIYNIGFNEIWYLIRDVKENSYIVKNRCGNEYAKDIMKKYKKEYNFFTINSNFIEFFDTGIYPIILKVTKDNFNKMYDKEKKINNSFHNNYYCQCDRTYKAIREYRNVVEYKEFTKEKDAINWCINNLIINDKTNNSLKPKDVFKYVYNESFGEEFLL